MSESRSNQWFSQILQVILPGIVFCVLFAHCAASLVEWYCKLIQPSDLDYAEGWHTYVAYQAYSGGDRVNSVYTMPYNTLPYPPLSYLIHGWIAQLGGTDLNGVRTIGRATAFMATLLNSIMVVTIARVIGLRLLWSAMAGLLFLTSEQAHFFAVSLRPDEMALALMLLGLYAVLKAGNYWLGGALFALALAAKHSFVSVPFVLLITLLIERDFRSVIKLFAGGFIVGIFIIFISYLKLGPYWWQGSLLQGFHGANLKQAIFFIGEGFRQPVLVIGLASVLLTHMSSSARKLAACFMVSLFLNSIALVKVGAAMNYFLEPVALGSILSGYAAKQLLDEQPLVSKGFAWALILGLIIPSTVEQSISTVKSLQAQSDTRYNAEPLVEVMRGFKEPILTDSANLYFESNHKPFVCPPDLIMAAVEGGKIDGKPMQEFIKRQGFNAVIVRTNWKERRFFSESWISAIEENYAISSVVSEYNVMKPKSKEKS